MRISTPEKDYGNDIQLNLEQSLCNPASESNILLMDLSFYHLFLLMPMSLCLTLSYISLTISNNKKRVLIKYRRRRENFTSHIESLLLFSLYWCKRRLFVCLDPQAAAFHLLIIFLFLLILLLFLLSSSHPSSASILPLNNKI